jgi:uncharacterized membrane protein
MSGLLDWAGANPRIATPAIVFGSIFGTGLLVSLAAISPFALVVLASIVFLAWLIVRTGALAGESGTEPESDPVTELERRYVRGEISEDEFERRLSVLLDADELAGRETSTEREIAMER